MRLSALIAAVLGVLLPASGHAQMQTIIGGATPAVAFTGVADSVTTIKAHWGFIAKNAATRGQNKVRLCNVGDIACVDVATDAVTGIVSSTQTVGLITCGSGANTCTVRSLYDPGGTYCSGSTPCQLDMATEATRPVFVPNMSGSVPGMSCNGSQRIEGTFVSTSLPITVLASSRSTVNPGGNTRIIGSTGTPILLWRAGPIGTFYMGGSNFTDTTTLSTSNLYALVGGADAGGNSFIAQNGTKTTNTTGGSTSSGASIALCADPGGGTPMTGYIIEAAVDTVAFTDPNISGVTSAMRTNGGF